MSYAGGGALEAFAGAPRYNDALLALFDGALGRRVLEVGAGIGTFTEMLLGCEKVLATDAEDESVAHLRRRFAGRPAVEVRRLDLEHVPVAELAAERLDTIFCSNVLEHVERHEQALRDLVSVVVPGGALLLLVPAHELLYGPTDMRLGHFRRYEREGLRRLLGDTGWQVESLRFFNLLGAIGWLVNGRLLGRRDLHPGSIRLYDRIAGPLLRLERRLPLPFGCSLAAVARRPAARATIGA